MEKPTFVFTEAHKTGLGAMLAQGESKVQRNLWHLHLEQLNCKTEYIHPQLDLEATGVDFGLRKFRHYLLRSPDETTVVKLTTNHCVEYLMVILLGR